MTFSKRNLSFAIIAGGKSSRFGSNKLFHLYNGKRLIDYSIDIAKTLSSEIMIIGDHKYPEDLSHHIIIQDIYKDCGPIAAIHTALKYSKNEHVAIIPGDMPFVSNDIYKLLISQIRSDKILIASSSKGLEPLISIWPKTYEKFLEQKIIKQMFSLQKFLKEVNFEEINLEKTIDNFNFDELRNVNYFSDL